MHRQFQYKINDKIVDLTHFIHLHPGGEDMFHNLQPNTNITPMIYSYHRNLPKVFDIISKYEIHYPKTKDYNEINYVHEIKFDSHYKYEKYQELKQIVYAEIDKNNIPISWSNSEIIYNYWLLLLYLGLWIYCICESATISVGWMFILSYMNIGYGALVFHEASHYCAFKNQTFNTVLSQTMIAPFITSQDWKYYHNYLHHSFTNSEFDVDFDASKWYIRHSNIHPHHYHHYYQYIYAYFLFFLVAFVKGPIQSISNKRYNIVLFLGILYIFGYMNTFVLYAATGFLFTLISQLSHIQYECIMMDRPSEFRDDYLYNQVSSSMNYRTNCLFFRFLVFGMDIQIEHHLFPNLPHSSLRQIQPIVREYCDRHGIPYIENSSILDSLYSYIKYLHYMSRRCIHVNNGSNIQPQIIYNLRFYE